jgi:hypothetical protein
MKMNMNVLIRQINLLNFMLLACAVLIIVFLVLPRFSSSITAPEAVPVPAEQAKGAPDAPPQVPTLQEYAVVSERNLFHSKRIIPPKKNEEVIQRPEFVLYGTLIMDNLRIAYLTDGRAPRSTPGRGNRQTGLKLGETMSGYTLKEVQHDRIFMVRGDDRMEIKVVAPGLKKHRGGNGSAPAAAASKSRASSAPAATAAAAPRSQTPPAPAVTPPPSAAGKKMPQAQPRRLREQQVPPNIITPGGN